MFSKSQTYPYVLASSKLPAGKAFFSHLKWIYNIAQVNYGCWLLHKKFDSPQIQPFKPIMPNNNNQAVCTLNRFSQRRFSLITKLN